MKGAPRIEPARVTTAAKEGRAYGEQLAEKAAHILLTEYNNRPQPFSPASERWADTYDQLKAALGVTGDDPRVLDALKALDDAHSDALVEIEDRAWHAAWHVATRLITGATFLRTNTHDVNALGSRKRRG